MSYHKKGREHHRWKGGIRRSNGYVYIYSPDHPHKDKLGYVKRARLIMEQKLDRYLTKDELVHHSNGVKDVDCIGNLFLCDRSSHGRTHGLVQGWSKKYECCVKCRRTSIPHHARGYCHSCYNTKVNRFLS